MPKDYDSTLVRVAGNIASGFVGNRIPHLTETTRDDIAATSLDIADRIITRAKEMAETAAQLSKRQFGE